MGEIKKHFLGEGICLFYYIYSLLPGNTLFPLKKKARQQTDPVIQAGKGFSSSNYLNILYTSCQSYFSCVLLLFL